MTSQLEDPSMTQVVFAHDGTTVSEDGCYYRDAHVYVCVCVCTHLQSPYCMPGNTDYVAVSKRPEVAASVFQNME